MAGPRGLRVLRVGVQARPSTPYRSNAPRQRAIATRDRSWRLHRTHTGQEAGAIETFTRAAILATRLAVGSRGPLRVRPAALLALLVAGALTGCEPGAITVPPGGQAVHVSVNGDAVHLEPATAPAGDIYLVLDTPGTDVTLVQAMAAADATSGPLTDEELDRVRHGDTFHRVMTGGFGACVSRLSSETLPVRGSNVA